LLQSKAGGRIFIVKTTQVQVAVSSEMDYT